MAKKIRSLNGLVIKPPTVEKIVPAPMVDGIDFEGNSPQGFTGDNPPRSKVDRENWARCLQAEREHLEKEAEVHAKELAEREAGNG